MILSNDSIMPSPKIPPFELTPTVLNLVARIMQLIGRFEGMQSPKPQLHLRRGSRIHTVLGSVAIEGNTLTLEQASAVFDGKRVVGPRRDVLELQNAIKAYDAAPTFKSASTLHLRRAHRTMMMGLISDAGAYRSKGVGVFQGSEVAHIAPPAGRVAQLVQNLFDWIKAEQTVDGLIVSAVAHYELEFIHPFSDGNGRVGRLWQHVVLQKRHPIFQWIPFESVIHGKQEQYYRVLGICDKAGASTAFIEFSLAAVLEALETFLADIRPEPLTGEQRLENFRALFSTQSFTRKDYLAHWKSVSTATASRDLRDGVAAGRLVREGEKALTRYRFQAPRR